MREDPVDKIEITAIYGLVIHTRDDWPHDKRELFPFTVFKKYLSYLPSAINNRPYLVFSLYYNP